MCAHSCSGDDVKLLDFLFTIPSFEPSFEPSVDVSCIYYRDCTELLILTSYVGGLVAMRRQYHSIVVPLYKHAMYVNKLIIVVGGRGVREYCLRRFMTDYVHTFY